MCDVVVVLLDRLLKIGSKFYNQTSYQGVPVQPVHCINAVTVKMELSSHRNDALIHLRVLNNESYIAIIRLLIAVDKQNLE